MKSWLGEYGRIAVLAVTVSILMLWIWNREDSGILGILGAAFPEATLGTADNVEILAKLEKREDPKLYISIRKLEHGKIYDLLENGVFGAKAEDADGNRLPVEIEKIVAPDGTVLGSEVDYGKFTAEQRGIYEIIYCTREVYQGAYIREVKQTCKFAVD